MQITNKSLREEVFAKTNGRCFHCGKKLKGNDACVDHVVPQYQGGLDDLKNLIPSCRKCNSARGPMTPAQYAKYLEKKRKRALRKLGSWGGLTTLKRHGRSHFSKIALAGWKKRKKKE